ncbi:MAG TPA: hypothetical protein VHS59_09705 [Bacillota bacterium]|nr:hypothetical protein [Bacillota bacterium]
MRISFLPKTLLGKRSVIIMVTSWVMFVVGSVLPWKPGYSGFDIVIQNPLQGLITLLLLALGLTTASMAMIAVFKDKERSVLVFLAILSGFYCLLGFIGSIANVFFNLG